jgi:hypothetical protein
MEPSCTYRHTDDRACSGRSDEVVQLLPSARSPCAGRVTYGIVVGVGDLTMLRIDKSPVEASACEDGLANRGGVESSRSARRGSTGRDQAYVSQKPIPGCPAAKAFFRVAADCILVMRAEDGLNIPSGPELPHIWLVGNCCQAPDRHLPGPTRPEQHSSSLGYWAVPRMVLLSALLYRLQAKGLFVIHSQTVVRHYVQEILYMFTRQGVEQKATARPKDVCS